jgi:hypothetical protein
MEAIGQEDGPRVLHRVAQADGTPIDPADGGGKSRVPRPAIAVSGLQMGDPPPQLVELYGLQGLEHGDPASATLALETAPHVDHGPRRNRAALGELGQVCKRDVDLAHRAERARHAPHLLLRTPERVVAASGGRDRQRLAQTARGDACLVHGRLVSGLCRRHGVEQRRQA